MAVSVLRPRLAVMAAFLANGLGVGAWAAGVPWAQARFGLSAPALGTLLLGLGVGAIAAMLMGGILVARLGSARVMRGAVWALALTAPLVAASPGVALLALGILLLGVVNGALDVAMNAQGAEVERRHGGVLMSSFHACFSVGALAGAAYAGLFGLAAVAWPIGALALGAARLGGLPDAARPAGEPAPRLAWPRRSMLGLCLLACCCMMGEGAMADWSALFMRDFGHAPPRLAGLGYAAFSLAMTIGRIGGDRLVRRFGATATVRGGGLLAALGLAAMLLAPGVMSGLAGLILVGLGLANVVPAVFSAAANMESVPPAAGIAIVATLGYGGFLLGPPVIGFIAGWSDLRVALSAIVAACLLVAGLASRVRVVIVR